MTLFINRNEDFLKTRNICHVINSLFLFEKRTVMWYFLGIFLSQKCQGNVTLQFCQQSTFRTVIYINTDLSFVIQCQKGLLDEIDGVFFNYFIPSKPISRKVKLSCYVA